MLSLKNEIVDSKPDKESIVTVPFTNILLIGQIGAGKSSFFNTVNSVFRGKMTSKARCGSFEHSLTMVVIYFDIFYKILLRLYRYAFDPMLKSLRLSLRRR